MRRKHITFLSLGIILGIGLLIIGVLAVLRMDSGHLGDLVWVGLAISGVSIWQLVVCIRNRKRGVAPGRKGVQEQNK